MIKLTKSNGTITVITKGPVNSSLSNKEVLKRVIKEMSEDINEIILLTDYFKKTYNANLLKGLGDHYNPILDYLKGSKELKESLLIKKALPLIKKGFNSSMIYNKLFVPKIKPLFIKSSIKKIKGKIISEYFVDKTKISIIKNNTGLFYVINPPEFNFNYEELVNVAKIIKEIKEQDFELDNFRLNVFKFINNKKISDKQKNCIIRHTIGFGLLDIIFRDENIQDTFIYSSSNIVNVNHSSFGELRTNIILSNEDLEAISTKVRIISGRPFDNSFPVIDYDLNDYNIRVCGVMEPLTFSGTGFAFRKHKNNPWLLTDFIKNKMINHEVAGLLNFLVDGQTSILITGPRGSGKTSLLSALICEVPINQRIIVIEDTPELPINQLSAHRFRIQHLRIKQSLSHGSYELSAEEALRTALRLGESVLIIGEVRSNEARALFEAMRVGAAGNVVMGTIHGSNPFDTFDRIVNDLNVPPSSFKATDVIISCSNLREGELNITHRRVIDVSEVSKEWVNTPIFNHLTSFDAKSRIINLNKISDSPLIKRISMLKGLSVKECINNIKLRGKAKKLVSELNVPLNPFINSLINSKINELLHYNKKEFLNLFRKYLLTINQN